MKILVTNDDGVEAAGIRALAAGLRKIKGLDVTVVAPERERSATSHSLTLHRPLRIIKKGSADYAVDGTPTDSVMLGCSVVLKGKPDLIVSGVNRGGNLGDDVHYSGTVSAAIEGGIMGIPAIAISQLGRDEFDYDMAVKFAQKLVGVAEKNGLPAGIVLNVNVPENVKNLDFEICKTGKRNYGDIYEERIDPRGRPYYWIGGNLFGFEDIPGSDCDTVLRGKISVTPIHVNLTDYQFIDTMKDWQW